MHLWLFSHFLCCILIFSVFSVIYPPSCVICHSSSVNLVCIQSAINFPRLYVLPVHLAIFFSVILFHSSSQAVLFLWELLIFLMLVAFPLFKKLLVLSLGVFHCSSLHFWLLIPQFSQNELKRASYRWARFLAKVKTQKFFGTPQGGTRRQMQQKIYSA